MSHVTEDLKKASELPEGDVVRILLQQHAGIRQLCATVGNSEGPAKRQAFDDLRVLLAVHETAEQIVVHTVTSTHGGETLANALNADEKEAIEMLARLEEVGVDSPEFDETFPLFQIAVEQHAEEEERVEFPLLLTTIDETSRHMMGKRLNATELVAPTHPHPGSAGSVPKQLATMPFHSIVDRVKDALSRS
ncbi:hemerythrin domain-containing protein [Nocardioides sp. NPDC006303]|uniref:hemerythrin domain-containing protein n=1 Tax=Nocardioides sp. NPDC006303 TaxID=3156747 RepID=UPI00339E8CEC